MPVIPVNRMVDPERIIVKMEARGGGEAHGFADPQKSPSKIYPNLESWLQPSGNPALDPTFREVFSPRSSFRVSPMAALPLVSGRNCSEDLDTFGKE
jgi:hypothetical protein